MKRISTMAAALAAGAIALTGAHAQARDHDHGRGHAYGHHKVHRKVVRRVIVRRHAPVRTRTVYVYRSGQYLPRTYYTQRTYYVTPTVYNLRPPPPGYEWVRVGNDVYLTQTSNGLIADVVANLFR